MSVLSRFSPAWHRGDPAAFTRLVGYSSAAPVNHDDPIHRERILKYETNISYYLQAQYEQANRHAVETQDFLGLRVNYTGIPRRSVDMKADWLFGEPLDVNAIERKTIEQAIKEGTTLDVPENDPKGTIAQLKARINQIRDHNHSDFWDWVMAVMGLVCGDFFVRVNAEVGDLHPTITLLDPTYVFPDYPNDIELPMRACQIQYDVDRDNESVDIDDSTPHTVRITEDYRLEIEGGPSPDDFEDLETVDDELLKEYVTAVEEGEEPPEKLVCVYRRFRDENLVEETKRTIDIPAIPIVHGVNSYIWNTRYGQDEVATLIPRVEKFNELFYYAERVARMNAHAKLFLSGVRADENPVRSDVDDVIYGGDGATANVLSLPTDVSVLKLVTDALEREMHRDAHIPVIAEGEAEQGYGAPSGLALLIRFGPMQAITKRHRLTYGDALDQIYTLALLFDELVIDGKNYGEKWKYDEWKFKFGWFDAMPKAEGEIITNMATATGGKILLSARTAREKLPGVDPDQEEERVKQETAEETQQQLDAAATAGGGAPTEPPVEEEVPPEAYGMPDELSPREAALLGALPPGNLEGY